MNKLRIRKIAPLSAAKIYGAIMLVMSLIISIPYGLIVILYSLIGASIVKGDAAFAFGGGGIVVGILIMIGLPIMYGIIGFIGGAIGALLYNLFAGIVGGIEIEVEAIA